jgi:hypothetical protein
MPNVIQPAAAWAIVDRDGFVLADSVSERRGAAIEWAESNVLAPWPRAKREEGVRCVRVTIAAAGGEGDA